MLEPKRRPDPVITGMIVFGLLCIVAILVLAFVFTRGSARPGPEAVFNSHIQAIEDQDWRYAHAFLASDCPFTVADVEEAFTRNPLDRDDWKVETVFLADDEALLWLPKAGLQYMYKEEGDWKVSCMGGPGRGG